MSTSSHVSNLAHGAAAQPRRPVAPAQESHGGGVHLWQRGVPVTAKLWTPASIALAIVAAIGLSIAGYRLLGNLRAVSGMTDMYAWGVWKTFNVMTLTALGTSGLSVGMAAWVFGRKDFHIVMRTALVMSLVFYFAGLLALGVDVGRPWNFYNVFLPWTWNLHSSLLEVAVCMPAYAFVFLLAENLPMVGERLFYRGSPAMRARVEGWRKPFRRVYPFVVAGAYMLPAMHQSSLGALMLLAGQKVHPLWQTPALPLLYLMQAGICGFAFVIVTLMLSCLVWQRPLDLKVIGALADWMSRLILVWLVVRGIDLVVRGELGRVFEFDRYSILFLVENALVLIPALVMRNERWRRTPQLVFKMAVATCVGGMAYRFIPTTVTYDPGWQFSYFPAVPELLVMIGFVALALLGFSFAVKLFAVLPAPYDDWLQSAEGRSYARNPS